MFLLTQLLPYSKHRCKWMRKLRPIIVLIGPILAIGFALLSNPLSVYAHAFLTHSDPPDGAVLSTAPYQVRLYFSESVSPGLTKAELVDGQGKSYTPLAVYVDAASPKTIVIDLPPLGSGI